MSRQPFFTPKVLILAKPEATYGTDPVPTAAVNPILAEAWSIEPTFKKLERKYARPYLGATPHMAIGQTYKIKFKTELKGSGAVGTAPEIGPLFRACNYAETITLNTSVAYGLISNETTGESVTVYFWKHHILHKIVGCRGTFVLTAKVTEIAYIEWDLTGLYAGPVDYMMPVGTFNATKPAAFINGSFTLDSFGAPIDTLKITLGNSIANRVAPNAASGIQEIFIKDRNPTGECDPEATPILAGAINVLAAAPTAAGTGYAVGDTFSIGDAAGTGATGVVLSISGGLGTGPVTGVGLLARGKNYTAGTGKATTNIVGMGSSLTVAVTSVFASSDAHDFWSLVTAGTLVALAAQVGSTAGSICAVSCPKVQIDDVKYGDRDNLLTNTLTLSLQPNVGNDEIAFLFT